MCIFSFVRVYFLSQAVRDRSKQFCISCKLLFLPWNLVYPPKCYYSCILHIYDSKLISWHGSDTNAQKEPARIPARNLPYSNKNYTELLISDKNIFSIPDSLRASCSFSALLWVSQILGKSITFKSDQEIHRHCFSWKMFYLPYTIFQKTLFSLHRNDKIYAKKWV